MTDRPREVDLIARLAAYAELFAADLAALPGVSRVATPDFRAIAEQRGCLAKAILWSNDVFTGPDFRWAHVEFFSIPDQIGVVHVCVFPHLDRQMPIFGFDIISGAKKATGAFLDLSPTTAKADGVIEAWAVETEERRAAFPERRTLPDWAAPIFSSHTLAIRPTSILEIEDVLALGRTSLHIMLAQTQAAGSPAPMAAAQERYARGQRANEHTFRMLANCVGPDLARAFVDDWLFPGVWAEGQTTGTLDPI